jgi:hypothetical protein
VQIFFKGYDNPKRVLNVWLVCQIIYRFVLFQTGPISILAIMLIETVSAPERRDLTEICCGYYSLVANGSGDKVVLIGTLKTTDLRQ